MCVCIRERRGAPAGILSGIVMKKKMKRPNVCVHETQTLPGTVCVIECFSCLSTSVCCEHAQTYLLICFDIISPPYCSAVDVSFSLCLDMIWFQRTLGAESEDWKQFVCFFHIPFT